MPQRRYMDSPTRHDYDQWIRTAFNGNHPGIDLIPFWYRGPLNEAEPSGARH